MRTLAIVAGLLLLALPAAWSAPQVLNIQGNLTESGLAVNGTRDTTFKIYDAASGGSPLFMEDHSGGDAVVYSSGVFNALVGSLSEIPLSVFDGADKYMEVSVTSAGVTTTLPRQRIVSVGYAFRAAQAESLAPGATAQFELIDVTTLTANIVTAASSITASAFFGDGSHLTGISGGEAGYFAGTKTFGSSVTATGAVLAGSSMTASAFFGDGSHLTGVAPLVESNTYASSKTFTSDVLVGSSITAGTAYVGSLHLGGITAQIDGFADSLRMVDPSNLVVSHIFQNNGGSATIGVSGSGFQHILSGGSNFALAFSPPPGHVIEFGYNGGAGVAVTISTIANVGIGTKLPRSILDIESQSTSDIPSTGTAAGSLALSNIAHSYGMSAGVLGSGVAWIQDGRFDGVVSAYGLAFNPAGGNVGIGTLSPAAVLDVEGNSQFGSGGSKSSFTMTADLVMATGSSITLSGAHGFLSSQSSVTAAAFFGDGSHLTGVGEGNTYASSKTFVSDVLAESSVTASAFFGDGSHLSGLSIVESNTYGSSKTFTSSVLAGSSVTASSFFGDGSHLSGIGLGQGTMFLSSQAFSAATSASFSLSLASANAVVDCDVAIKQLTTTGAMHLTFNGDSGVSNYEYSHQYDSNSALAAASDNANGFILLHAYTIAVGRAAHARINYSVDLATPELVINYQTGFHNSAGNMASIKGTGLWKGGNVANYGTLSISAGTMSGSIRCYYSAF